MNFDLYFFNLINQFAGKWQWLDLSAIFFAKYFEYILLFYLLLFLAKNSKKYWVMVKEGLLTAIFARFIIGEIIYKIWFRQRPFVNKSAHLLLPNYNPQEASFPSGHALFYFALSTIIYNYNKKAGILLYIGSFLIVIARVFVGVHWPLDIIAGAILGIVTGLLLNKLFKMIKFLNKQAVDK